MLEILYKSLTLYKIWTKETENGKEDYNVFNNQ